MRVSDAYGLGRSQPELEFLDVDITDDVKAFIDPHALKYIESDWARECTSLLQDFFTEVLHSIRTGNDARAQALLAQLSEPNETHLGLSVSTSAGSGISAGLAKEMWLALRHSRAATTGLLADLEDATLFVEGISYDRISDITTNIIRGQLIRFTQDACSYYGIPLVPNVVSGPLWNRQRTSWTQEYTSLPVPPGTHTKLLLVPKSIVRRTGIFSPGEYYNHYILPFLQHEEIQQWGPLVQVRKAGGAYVTKKSLRERDAGPAKRVNLDVTLREPGILEQYRAEKAEPREPLSHSELAVMTHTPDPDWEVLLAQVCDVPPGKEFADDYHRSVQALLTALFYPALDMPRREHKIHQGRKRIDINYTNMAVEGFFWWLINVARVAAAQVAVECKNYGILLKNPEFDQLTGRFSPTRGKFGFLCHRGFNDKDDVIQRCRDAALDDRGYVVALDDGDLRQLVQERQRDGDTRFDLLITRFQELT